jgi:RHS repeat-associated protein
LVGVSDEATTYGYDAANRLRTITYRGQTTTLEYDAAGRLTLKVLPNGIRQELAYDDADRLLSIAYRNPDNSIVESIAYGYDATGQRVSETKGTNPLPDTAFSAVYDAADRMTSITLTATGQTFLLSYDDNGNLIEKRDEANASNLTTYAWDGRNRLKSVTAPGLSASFDYDALGRRTSRTLNGVTTRYVYDGLQAFGEVINGEQIGVVTTLNLDEVIARYTSQGARVFLTDALNTVLAQIGGDRSPLNYYAYSPYGEVTALGTDEGNSIQYTARENDQTGLYFYRARYYDPVLKRFITQDPMALAAGPNVYGYVLGDPISRVDPEGNLPILVPIVTGVLGAAASGLGYAAGRMLRGCDVKFKDLAIAMGVGAVQGALLPFVGPWGNAALGGIGNVLQDALTADGPMSAGDVAKSFGLGAAGAAIGGSYTRGVGYGYNGTRGAYKWVDDSNAMRDLGRNATLTNFGRSIAGSTFSTAGGSNCDCRD